MIGSFIFVLHSHVPYVRKSGKWPHGEEMLFEIIAETYLPLLNAFDSLQKDGIKANLTLGLTPILIEQLNDRYMQREFIKYINSRIAAAKKDHKIFETDRPEALNVNEFYIHWYEQTLNDFVSKWDEDIVGAFKHFQDHSGLDIITSAATHGYLPLFSRDSAIWGQLKTGIKQYQKVFGRKPSGIWLPECGYRPMQNESRKGIEHFLDQVGLQYFFTDTHVIESAVYSKENNSEPNILNQTLLPAYDAMILTNQSSSSNSKRSLKKNLPDVETNTFQPYFVSNSNVYVFGRDEVTGMQVWSAHWGYPGDFTYREFHKKSPTSGIQYWKISNRAPGLKLKELYNPQEAQVRAKDHAHHFVGLVTDHLKKYKAEKNTNGVVVSSYDTELFGHWWFEGVNWIENVLRNFAKENLIEVISARDYTNISPQASALEIPESSWGNGGQHSTWLNQNTENIWQKIHSAECRFENIVNSNKYATGIRKKVLNQAARELLLLQSSDWTFLITTVQARDYAEKRFEEFYARFNLLCDFLEHHQLTVKLPESFDDIFEKDNVFPGIDYHDFL